MITPETWDFPPPPSSIVSKSVPVKEIPALIQNQPFNNLVCVTLPDCVQAPDYITSLLTEDCEFYKIHQLYVKELINPVFVDAFVKKGNLLALSTDTPFDLEDCFAFNQSHLTLSVQPETYQTLGLEGQTVSYKTSKTHVIKINVTDGSFVPSKKQYDRAVSRFADTKLAFDTILAWSPHDERVCPSSIAEYLTRAGYKVELCTPQLRTVHKYSTRVPDLAENKPEHVLEWIGALALDCDMDKVDVESTTDMEVPTTSITWKGIYSAQQIQTLFQSLLTLIESKTTMPWISMNVQGFFKSAVCHREQHYTVIVDNQLGCNVHRVTSR